MNSRLRTDQCVYLDRSCPTRTDLHPTADVVEVVLGECRFGDDTLRLVINDPDTLLQLQVTLDEARTTLIKHLHAKAHPDPAMSHVDRGWIGPVAS